MIKRINVLMKQECSLELRETKLARKSALHRHKLEKLRTRIREQEKNLEATAMAIEKQRETNVKLENALEQNNEEAQLLQDQITQLQQIAESNTASELTTRKLLMLEEEKLRHLSDLTGFMINEEAMPNYIQGASLVQRPISTLWLPINIDPECHTIGEVQSILWDKC